MTNLESGYGYQVRYLDRNTIKGQINHVFVDLITHAYPMINDLIIEEGIRFASLEDIAAMKLNAITGNGTRLKDFTDIAFLSSYLSLAQMTDAYEKKYRMRNSLIALKSLAYYKDINFNEPIRFSRGTYSWKAIENRINEMIKSRDKVFSNTPF